MYLGQRQDTNQMSSPPFSQERTTKIDAWQSGCLVADLHKWNNCGSHHKKNNTHAHSRRLNVWSALSQVVDSLLRAQSWSQRLTNQSTLADSAFPNSCLLGAKHPKKEIKSRLPRHTNKVHNHFQLISFLSFLLPAASATLKHTASKWKLLPLAPQQCCVSSARIASRWKMA